MKAVIFDLDGTLLDTVPEIAHCLNSTLEEFSLPTLTAEETRKKVGNGAAVLVERAVRDIPCDHKAVLARFRELYAASDNSHTLAYDGIPELLAMLKGAGVKLAVLTNKPARAAVNSIRKFFPDTFDLICGDDGNFPLKPDPSYARYIALTLRAAPCDCVVVGDGETDVQTAINAKMRGVCALWGYRSRAELIKAGGESFAETPSGLGKILRNFLQIS